MPNFSKNIPWFRTFLFWLPFAATITILCLLVYGAVQHSLRQGANDPQIQMAEDAANRLNNGDTPGMLVSPFSVDIAKSLAPYLIILNDAKEVMAASVMLDGKTPTIPSGVFDYVRKYGEERVTWQPRPSIRQALVIKRFTSNRGGFVVAGRSMREVEKREDFVFHAMLLVWLLGLGATFVLSVLYYRYALPKLPTTHSK